MAVHVEEVEAGRLEVAATASSTKPAGPFSIAFRHATTAVVEGVKVAVPSLED